MVLVGIDLSGPCNPADTAAIVTDESCRCLAARDGLLDADIVDLIGGCEGRVIVAVDAPLSYAEGGGMRPADRALRDCLTAAGLPAGCVIAPTLTRMAYLTLRGIALARALRLACGERVEVVEASPTGALVLRGASAGDVREMKRQSAARERLRAWVNERIGDLPEGWGTVSHHLAAAGAVLAAHGWATGTPCWSWPAELPHHPHPVVV